MKKFKILPSLLMLVVCVGVLAVGIFALAPRKNTINGTINITASSSPIKLEVFVDNTNGTPIKTYPSVRGGEQIKINELLGGSILDFYVEDANTIEDVYEPYLLQLGFINRTPRGRVVTKLAYEHFGIKWQNDWNINLTLQ